MSILSESDQKLIHFLKELATKIEEKKLSPEQEQSIGEFYMNYTFDETTDTNNTNNTDNTNTNNTGEDFSSSDIIKFISMGWYFYRIILDEQKNKSTETESTTLEK